MDNQAVSNLDSLLDDAQTPSKQQSSKKPYFDENRKYVDLFDKLYDEYKEDCDVNYANLGDKVMKVPAIKQKWVARMCKYRNITIECEKMLSEETEAEADKIASASKLKITHIAAVKAASSSGNHKIAVLTERVGLLKRINDVLDDINQHMKYFNQEIQCVVEYVRMENS